MRPSWTNSLEIEQRVQEIITGQELHGVCFDKQRAGILQLDLIEKRIKLRKKIHKDMGMETIKPTGASVKKPYAGIAAFTKDGGLSKRAKAWVSKGGDLSLVSGLFCPVSFQMVDIDSRQKVMQELLRHGWKPDKNELTDKGNPRLIVNGQPVNSLSSLLGAGKELALYYVYGHRLSQIKGFYRYLWYDTEGNCRISAEINPLATNTHRGTHRKVANIPKAKAYVIYGYQMRSLFTVPKGYKMMGTDAAGLELRCLAHYVNDSEYTEEIVNGDAHTRHQLMAGLPTRDDAKTFIYAFLYGAGVGKLGSIIGGGAKQGNTMKQKFLTANPKLDKLIGQVTKLSERGWLKVVDGRKVPMRRTGKNIHSHKALNTLLQATGSIMVKYGMVMLNDWVKELGLKSQQVIWYHDEVQWEVPDDEVEIMSRLMLYWMTMAGDVLKFRCPLSSDVGIGKSWRYTH